MKSLNSISEIAGVFSGGINAGIKPSAKDLAFLYLPQAIASAGVFTKNSFRAACIDYNRNQLHNNIIKAIIINSGNANAATGKQGMLDCQEMAQLSAKHLSLSPSQVCVASTGIIGKQLPMPIIKEGIKKLLANPESLDSQAAAEAIMTTDLVSKEVAFETTISGNNVRIGGIAKGSGMIAPNMATMLGFIVSDAKISNSLLKEIFPKAIDRSFNMISVDTDTSTNDMVLCISNAQSECKIETEQEIEQFQDALTKSCIELAKMIARDGEGATKLIEVQIQGAASEDDARKLALSVVNSPLVKTAIHGQDPNWGRVAMALGKTPDVKIDPQATSISFQGQQVFANGQPVEFCIDTLRKALAANEITISASLGLGTAEAKAWGCDLTKGYIDINVDYN